MTKPSRAAKAAKKWRGIEMNHIPVAIGLVLCEVVIVDEKSHNVTAVNCFNPRKVKDFPASVEFFLLAWLADGLGEMPVEVIVDSLETLEEIHRVEKRLRFDDPLKDKYFLARIRECVFPTAGPYVVSLFACGELIAHRKIRVYQ